MKRLIQVDDEAKTPAMIKLVCLTCNRTIAYGRGIDPSIPSNVARIEQLHCDECWNGEREGETWYDGRGNEVSQRPHQPIRKDL